MPAQQEGSSVDRAAKIFASESYELRRAKASDLFGDSRAKNFPNFSLDFRKRCSKLAVALKTRSLLLDLGMGKIKEPTPSNWELSSARVLHAPVAER